MHHATRRAATEFVEALSARVDIGVVFPPRDGEPRGRGVWYANAISGARGVIPCLGRAAAANAAGAAVYVRLHCDAKDRAAPHPGVVLVDDLSAKGVEELRRAGLMPCAIVETSPGNFQTWVRLATDCRITCGDALAAARELAARFGGDPRAVSATQPGRLPGFTNRKTKYQRPDGSYPFVRLCSSTPGLIGSRAAEFLRSLPKAAAPEAQAARAGSAPETPHAATLDSQWPELDALRLREKARIDGEVASGRRPAASGSPSEVDFAVAVHALADGVPPGAIEAWLAVRRSDHCANYAGRTVANAARFVITSQATASPSR
jgi:hypothetical protein